MAEFLLGAGEALEAVAEVGESAALLDGLSEMGGIMEAGEEVNFVTNAELGADGMGNVAQDTDWIGRRVYPQQELPVDYGAEVGAEEASDSFYYEEKGYAPPNEGVSSRLLPEGQAGQTNRIGAATAHLNQAAEYAEGLKASLTAGGVEIAENVGTSLLGAERMIAIRGLVKPLISLGGTAATLYGGAKYLTDMLHQNPDLPDSDQTVHNQQSGPGSSGQFHVPIDDRHYINVQDYDASVKDAYGLGYNGGLRDNLFSMTQLRDYEGRIISRNPVGIGQHYAGSDIYSGPFALPIGNSSTGNMTTNGVHSSVLMPDLPATEDAPRQKGRIFRGEPREEKHHVSIGKGFELVGKANLHFLAGDKMSAEQLITLARADTSMSDLVAGLSGGGVPKDALGDYYMKKAYDDFQAHKKALAENARPVDTATPQAAKRQKNIVGVTRRN